MYWKVLSKAGSPAISPPGPFLLHFQDCSVQGNIFIFLSQSKWLQFLVLFARYVTTTRHAQDQGLLPCLGWWVGEVLGLCSDSPPITSSLACKPVVDASRSPSTQLKIAGRLVINTLYSHEAGLPHDLPQIHF